MDETKVVEVGGKSVRVNVFDDSAQAEVVETVEAKLVTDCGYHLHLSDLAAASIERSDNESYPWVVYFNNEDRHSESPSKGNRNEGEYDRNWYFTDLRTE